MRRYFLQYTVVMPSLKIFEMVEMILAVTNDPFYFFFYIAEMMPFLSVK